MATVYSVLGPLALPKAPYGSFAGKPASSGGGRTYTQTFSVLGPLALPKMPYGSFAGKPTSNVTSVPRTHPFFATMGQLTGY